MHVQVARAFFATEEPAVAELPYFGQFDHEMEQGCVDDWLCLCTCCKGQSRHKFHSANHSQSQYPGDKHYSSPQMQEQLDCADDIGPSWRNALRVAKCHIDSDFLGTDSETLVEYQKTRFPCFHPYL
jgi:hypothetical protein